MAILEGNRLGFNMVKLLHPFWAADFLTIFGAFHPLFKGGLSCRSRVDLFLKVTVVKACPEATCHPHGLVSS